MKYIDAEQLKTKVKELNLVTKTYEEQVAFNNALAMVVEIIDSLQQEQPEVDLEKEYQEFCKDYPFPWSSQYVNREYIDELCLSVARHFYELGRLNARK